MTLAEARTWMMNNPGEKITCQYFHNEWIMWDNEKLKFVFEDGVTPDAYWWSVANNYKCDWYELK